MHSSLQLWQGTSVSNCDDLQKLSFRPLVCGRVWSVYPPALALAYALAFANTRGSQRIDDGSQDCGEVLIVADKAVELLALTWA